MRLGKTLVDSILCRVFRGPGRGIPSVTVRYTLESAIQEERRLKSDVRCEIDVLDEDLWDISNHIALVESWL